MQSLRAEIARECATQSFEYSPTSVKVKEANGKTTVELEGLDSFEKEVLLLLTMTLP